MGDHTNAVPELPTSSVGSVCYVGLIRGKIMAADNEEVTLSVGRRIIVVRPGLISYAPNHDLSPELVSCIRAKIGPLTPLPPSDLSKLAQAISFLYQMDRNDPDVAALCGQAHALLGRG